MSRFIFWAGLSLFVGAVLLRLGAWALGDAYRDASVQDPPQIIRWDVDHADFGGMSALIMAPDGQSLVAGGDHGALVEARVLRDAAGRITGFENNVLSEARLRGGAAPRDFKMDLEALSPDPEGGWFVAYENVTRIERLAHATAAPRSTHLWDRFVHLFNNQAFEALATLPGGRVLAVAEVSAPVESALWDGSEWQVGPAFPVTPGYLITGADVGPDGCLYLVERRYGLRRGFTFGLRRVSGGPGNWNDTLLYRSAPARLGNAEAVSVWGTDAEITLTVLTDDGFWPLTPTRVMEWRVPAGVGCALNF